MRCTCRYARGEVHEVRCTRRGAHEMRCTHRGERVDMHEVRFTRCGACEDARDCNMYVQWDIQYILGLQTGETAGEQPAPGSGGEGVGSGVSLLCSCMQHVYIHVSCRLRAGEIERGLWG